MIALRYSLFLLGAAPLLAQISIEVAPVVSRIVQQTAKLPGEFQPYLSVPVYARVTAFVSRIDVDRGTAVKKGQLLARLEAPELMAQVAEAEARVQAVELQKAEAEAKLASAQSTYDRLKAASSTPGAVAGNDVTVAEKNVDAARALVQATAGSIAAARSAAQAVKDLSNYLSIDAPFDGVVVERNVHPGALVGPGSGSAQMPLLKLEQVARLRLVVAVPEALVGGIARGAWVSFAVPAFPAEQFRGVVSRVAHSLDQKSRSMPVELDVENPGLRLAPGMYPEIAWPVRSSRPALLVPATAVVTTSERMFVIRLNDGVAEWVDVTRGAGAGDLLEVLGPLKPGDLVVRRGTDELRAGTRVVAAKPNTP